MFDDELLCFVTTCEDYPEPERRCWMVRLWLRSFGPRRPRRAGLFGDYDGVAKVLDRGKP